MHCKITKKSISSNITISFFICSIFFALIGACVHTLVEHNKDLYYMEANIERVEKGRNILITNDVVNNDIKALKVHVDGIVDMIYGIEYIAIFNDKSLMASHGSIDDELKMYDILLEHGDKEVGNIRMGFNLKKINILLLKDFTFIFSMHMILNCMLSILIFIYVRNHIVKPLDHIAKNVELTDLFTKKIDSLDDFICRGDEVGCVANAIYAMQSKLHNSLSKLRKSEDHNQILIDNVPAAALVIENEKIVFCNRAALNLFSVKDNESLIGKKFVQYIDQSSLAAIRSCHSDSVSAINCNKCIEQDCRKVKKIFSITMHDTQGEQKYAELIFVKNNDCMEGTCLVFLKDTTQSVVLQGEKDVWNQRTMHTQKMEAIGKLAGGIAHDFNNILTGILGYSELIKMSTEEDRTREDIGYVIKAAERSSKLIEHLLSFCRNDYNNKKTSIDLKEIIEEVLKLLQSTVPPTIEFTSTLNAVGNVMANATQMHQVLMNLCTNAVYAIQECGDDTVGIVDINLSETYLTNEDVRLLPKLQSGHFVKLDISDNGSGISSKIISNIFEPCFTTKPAKEGTGMGLSVVYGIIDNYDGYILVNSEIGKGTKFVIYLPMTYEKKNISSSSDIHKDITSIQGSGKILVVDDEIMITNVLKIFLEKVGYSVHIENTPALAIEYFAKYHDEIDCIVTDLMMPGMSGVTLTKLLQDIDSVVPIIWCTGHLSFESQTNAENLGVVEVIQKPVDGYEVASAIHDYLST